MGVAVVVLPLVVVGVAAPGMALSDVLTAAGAGAGVLVVADGWAARPPTPDPVVPDPVVLVVVTVPDPVVPDPVVLVVVTVPDPVVPDPVVLVVVTV
ncbi:hypothetical protein ACIA8E_40740, partial [Streptomyces sp. NPDC051664]|uniref:hypothetical protein n=1 Tax=Streptomyces sp. NPDC051664 TaxID=3365668 RepID=UPI0037B49635